MKENLKIFNNYKILVQTLLQYGAGWYKTFKVDAGQDLPGIAITDPHSRFFAAPGNNSLKDQLHKDYLRDSRVGFQQGDLVII